MNPWPTTLSSLAQNMGPKGVGTSRNPTTASDPRDKPGVSRALNAIMGTRLEPRGQPSLITAIINTDSTQTWTAYKMGSQDLNAVLSTGWGGANPEETSQDLVRRALVHGARSHNQNLMFRRAAVANKKEEDPTPRTKTLEQALGQMRTDRAGSLPRHPRPNWTSAG